MLHRLKSCATFRLTAAVLAVVLSFWAGAGPAQAAAPAARCARPADALGSTPSPFGFVGGQGYQTDPDSGLMLLGARYYDPSLGRFLSRDPLGYGGGDVNLYRYCGNDPVNATDPLGLASLGAWIGGGIAAGAVIFAAVVGAPLTVPTFGIILFGAAVGSALDSPGDDPCGMVLDATEVSTTIAPGTGYAAGIAPVMLGRPGGSLGPPIGGGGGSLPPGRSGGGGGSPPWVSPTSIPPSDLGRLSDTLMHIDAGGAPTWILPYRIGKWGSEYRNQPPILPPGVYAEYDVPPSPGVKPPGPDRIVQGSGGDTYWSWDHYGSFVRLR